jgi:hypothetical protein
MLAHLISLMSFNFIAIITPTNFKEGKECCMYACMSVRSVSFFIAGDGHATNTEN